MWHGSREIDMKLGIIPEQGGSIINLSRSGQHTRFLDAYIGEYARAFDRVRYYSYLPESVRMPPNCAVVPNPGYHRWLYAFALPVVQRESLRTCSVLRVMQAYGAIPAMAAKIRWGMPFVMTWGYRYTEVEIAKGQASARAGLLDARATLAARMADRVIVTTPAMADYVAPHARPGAVVLIPNGVDTELFRPPAETVGRRQQGARTVCYVGRLSAEKNVGMLIEAVARLNAEGAPYRVRLLLIGQGPLRDSLAAKAEVLGVETDFAGVLPNEALPARMAQCDAFVLPSLGEGHPKALLEAMSCGLPCIGTNVKGVRDVLRHEENGLLCTLNAEALAAALRRVLTDPALATRLGNAARADVVQQYDLRRLVQREIAMMQEVVRAGR
jgi:glycosyltransferase involved in cell wall biosynthesis